MAITVCSLCINIRDRTSHCFRTSSKWTCNDLKLTGLKICLGFVTYLALNVLDWRKQTKKNPNVHITILASKPIDLFLLLTGKSPPSRLERRFIRGKYMPLITCEFQLINMNKKKPWFCVSLWFWSNCLRLNINEFPFRLFHFQRSVFTTLSCLFRDLYALGLANFIRCLDDIISEITALIRLTLLKVANFVSAHFWKKKFTLPLIHWIGRRAADGNAIKLNRPLTKCTIKDITNIMTCYEGALRKTSDHDDTLNWLCC